MYHVKNVQIYKRFNFCGSNLDAVDGYSGCFTLSESGNLESSSGCNLAEFLPCALLMPIINQMFSAFSWRCL